MTAYQVLGHQGYDGAAADVWSCGVILFVLMAGYLPFEETDLPTLYRKVSYLFSRGIKQVNKVLYISQLVILLKLPFVQSFTILLTSSARTLLFNTKGSTFAD